MATLKQTLKMYLKVATTITVGGYCYLYYDCKKRREESMDEDLIHAKKDTTRPSNQFYGINWGYRADETIEKTLDTGDLLFFNYDCNKLFTPEEVLYCQKQKFERSLKEADA
jgi:hypothetical protein